MYSITFVTQRSCSAKILVSLCPALKLTAKTSRWSITCGLGYMAEVEEITVFFRPLPAAAAALRLIGAGLARRMGPARAALISTLAHPLVFMSRVGDGIGVRLVRSVL